MSEKSTLGDILIGIETGKSFQTSEIPARPDQLGVLKVSAVSWSEFLPSEAKALKGEYIVFSISNSLCLASWIKFSA